MSTKTTAPATVAQKRLRHRLIGGKKSIRAAAQKEKDSDPRQPIPLVSQPLDEGRLIAFLQRLLVGQGAARTTTTKCYEPAPMGLVGSSVLTDKKPGQGALMLEPAIMAIHEHISSLDNWLSDLADRLGPVLLPLAPELERNAKDECARPVLPHALEGLFRPQF